MSEEKFDPKKFASYKFKAQETLLKVLKPQARRTPQAAAKKQSTFADTLKVLIAAFIVATIFRMFIVQMFYVPSDAMEPTFGVNDRILVNKMSYGIGNPLWGAYDTPKLLYVIPNPLYKKAFGASKDRYISNSGKTPRRWDVIVYKDLTSGFYGIKRVVGLPGEQLKIKKGVIYINGRELKERYRIVKDGSDQKSLKVPPASYFLLGDNRPASSDSRIWGPLPANRVIGVVFMRIWPLSRVRTY
jgi:signal peptidase I